MKNFITKQLAFFILFISNSMTVFAKAEYTNQPLVSELLPRSGESDAVRKNYAETGAVADLPDISLEAAGTSIIKTILGWGSVFAIIAVVVAGVYYIIARGKEDDITKAKQILLYLIIGMVIMSSAYAVVSGVLDFRFFEE
jgi:hypothetical protein